MPTSTTGRGRPGTASTANISSAAGSPPGGAGAPVVAVLELADSSVNFAVRVWVDTADYWPTYFEITEAVKRRFDEEGISIPYPQQDVHMHQPGTAEAA